METRVRIPKTVKTAVSTSISGIQNDIIVSHTVKSNKDVKRLQQSTKVVLGCSIAHDLGVDLHGTTVLATVLLLFHAPCREVTCNGDNGRYPSHDTCSRGSWWPTKHASNIPEVWRDSCVVVLI